MTPNSVFVFGSNLAGRHGKGAALHARQHYGAIYGVGKGRQGQSYAIPTKDTLLKTLDLHSIRDYVYEFLCYARENPDASFFVTAIGTAWRDISMRKLHQCLRVLRLTVFFLLNGQSFLNEGHHCWK